MSIEKLQNVIDSMKSNVEDMTLRIEGFQKSVDQMKSLPNDFSFTVNSVKPLDEVIEEYIRWTLIQCDGDQTKTAKKLCIARSTLWRYLKK